MHGSTIGVIAPATEVLNADHVPSLIREPVCSGDKNLVQLMVRFAEQLAFNAISDELERMTENEFRAAVMLYAAHL